jgi:hypothetical protein
VSGIELCPNCQNEFDAEHWTRQLCTTCLVDGVKKKEPAVSDADPNKYSSYHQAPPLAAEKWIKDQELGALVRQMKPGWALRYIGN